jgi:hypothetical protein
MIEGEIDPGEKDWKRGIFSETTLKSKKNKKTYQDDGIWRGLDAVDCDMVWRTGTISLPILLLHTP